MKPRVSFRLTPIAAILVLTLACDGTPEAESTEPTGAELRGSGAAECMVACRRVVACLGGGYGGSGSYDGGYGGGYGDYGGSYGDYGGSYGDYGGGYGDYSSGYGGGYGTCGGGYAECGTGPSSPEWCGYGGYGDGYGGYGSLPGYGGTCTGGGTNMLGQCVAGCRALPARPRRHLLTCVMSAHTCQARLACE
jgi:hypothetical protein